MSLKIIKKLCPTSKHSRKCPYSMKPEYITIHNTYNDAPAKNEVNYMLSNNNQVSYHYAVDDKEAVQAIKTNRNAWHAGDGSGSGNRKSIGIEICYSKSGGERFDRAERNAAELAARLLKSRNWGISRVKRHKDWSGKDCPHRTIDRGWQRFLNMVQDELDRLNGKSGKPYKATVTAKDGLNVRTGKGVSFKRIRTLPYKAVITVYETSNGWAKISKDKAEWVSAAYLKRQ